VFSEQDDGLVGWSDAISTNPLMNLEPDEASFSIELDQALNAHIARVVEDAVSGLVVSKRRYNAFRPCEGSHVVLSADWVSQECWRPANDSPMVWSITAPARRSRLGRRFELYRGANSTPARLEARAKASNQLSPGSQQTAAEAWCRLLHGRSAHIEMHHDMCRLPSAWYQR